MIPISGSFTSMEIETSLSLDEGDGKKEKEIEKKEIESKPKTTLESANIKIIEKSKFDELFKKSTFVDQGEFNTTKSNGNSLHTTSVATCVAFFAKSYIEGNCISHGLIHEDSSTEETSYNFLMKMAPSKSNITKLVICAFGGYESWEKDLACDLFRKSIEKFQTKNKKVEIEIKTKLINPWGMDESYENFEQVLDQQGICLSAGITGSGDIYVSDESALRPIDDKSGFLQYQDPRLQKLLKTEK